MSCSCSKKKSQLPLIEEEMTLPFETCIECAIKHLSYALVLESGFENFRALGQVYLAYKHLEKFYIEEAKTLFKMIKDYFSTFKFNVNEINDFIHMLNKMEIKKVEDGICLDLEEKALGPAKVYILYLEAANELLNFEPAYLEINKPYAIGLILRAAEHVPEPTRLKLRNFWKSNDENIFYDLQIFLKEEIEIYKKIFLHK